MRLTPLAIATLLFSATTSYATDILFYNGVGATSGDVAALENMMKDAGFTYTAYNAAGLKGLTLAEIEQFKLILWPGGNSINQGDSLYSESPEILTNIHDAVVDGGLSYIGFCAGAFMAESTTEYHVFDLASTYFKFYDAGAIEMVKITLPNSSKTVVYWDGPETNFGYTVAKYPNGTQAIGEGKLGTKNGFVILSGVHPEAALDWDVPGYTSSEEQTDNAYARALIKAAYNKTLLPHF
jgi:glutamine amidotransferase-like uncharacterized protein